MTAELALTGFLLARITDDDERARKRMKRAQETHLTLQDPGFLGRRIPGWHEWPGIESDAAHVLADCDAKRLIVEPWTTDWTARDLAGLDSYRDEDSWRYGIYSEVYHALLRILALPYAEHPDYRQEWRP